MRRPAKRFPRKPFEITLAVGLTACGGNVFGGESGSGGSAGSGASGTSGAGGSGGSDPGCPATVPVSGTTCAGKRACDYPFCGVTSNQTATCVSGKWQVMPHSSCNPPPPFTCPATLPTPDSPCTPVAEGMSCQYAGKPCCPTESATCTSGVWRVPTVDCNPPPPLPCPAAPPVAGTPCKNDVCAWTPAECSYGDCSQGSRLVMICGNSGVWQAQPTACPGQPCEGLDFCACFARSDCKYLTDTCICPCDYHCPGQPACVCACGGGNYLGCAPR